MACARPTSRAASPTSIATARSRTDADAATWFAPQYSHPVIAETDPRYIRTRALVDKAWEMFKAANPMGKLADAHLALVMLEDPQTNAFVTSDVETGKAAVSIQVLAGLYVDGVTDDDILGVMFHELEHMYGLHVRARRPRTSCAASTSRSGSEPIGAHEGERREHRRRARTSGAPWRSFAGPYDTGLLGELPYGGNVGATVPVDYLAAVADARQRHVRARRRSLSPTLYTELAPRSSRVRSSR